MFEQIEDAFREFSKEFRVWGARCYVSSYHARTTNLPVDDTLPDDIVKIVGDGVIAWYKLFPESTGG